MNEFDAGQEIRLQTGEGATRGETDRSAPWSVLLIGDVHGKLGRFSTILAERQPERSIQLGDLGMRKEHLWFLENLDADRHKVLFGNHDFMPFLNKPHSLGDWSFPHPEVMAIRGADSIDRRFRSTGLNWWPNEELSYERMKECVEAYCSARPRVVLSHDCPDVIRRKTFGIHDSSRTSEGLQACFESHQPDLWIFAHHHASVRRTFLETTFVCLNELESCLVTLEGTTVTCCPAPVPERTIRTSSEIRRV